MKSYYSPFPSCTPGLACMRLHHRHIKQLLYSLFGSASSMDLCCGKLLDIGSYADAKMHKVLAVDIDKEALKIAKLNQSKCSNCEVTLLQADLSIPNSLVDIVTKASSIFCHFAVHYFFASVESTSTFITNFLPLLEDNGLVIVTYMEGDSIRNNLPCLITSNGEIEFSATKLIDSDEKINVYIKSIGQSHVESIVDSATLIERFASHGLECIQTLKFSEFDILINDRCKLVLMRLNFLASIR